MKDILDYRVVILDKESRIREYPVTFGMHQTCLDDFAKRCGYEYSSEEYLVKQGNVIFKNAGLGILLVYLPSFLSDEQLYQMDYIHNWLEKVTLLEGCKYLDNDRNKYQWYQCDDDVLDYFSKEIVQSYYSGKKR